MWHGGCTLTSYCRNRAGKPRRGHVAIHAPVKRCSRDYLLWSANDVDSQTKVKINRQRGKAKRGKIDLTLPFLNELNQTQAIYSSNPQSKLISGIRDRDGDATVACPGPLVKERTGPAVRIPEWSQ